MMLEEVNTNSKVVDMIKDLSSITTIPVRTLDKLVSQMDWCICEAIHESNICNEKLTMVDVGIGTIYIDVSGDEVKYKFIPSSKLEKYIISTIVSGKNPLQVNLESTFVNRIIKTYKDMF